MAINFSFSCFLLISLTCSLFTGCHCSSDEDKKVYVVYMGDRPKSDISVSALHISRLQNVVGSGASDSLLHSYHRSFNGFVAKLTKEEKEKMAGLDGVVSVFPSQKKKLHTTRSWDFMGFPQNVTRATSESDIIVAMLDTGIWPESESFNDEGYGPPPSKWKGTCQASSNFTCNNKIIGARYYHIEGKVYPGDFASPRDSEGHGTHTASTAAGRLVSEASLLGLATGTARGGVPSARIAVYKICWSDGCSDADILAAFDDAIADGVDIISLSVARRGQAMDYFEDSIAIGAFHSMKNGILTSNAAGNSGPGPETISNCSPWSLSVAASTIDRKFVTSVMLGNGAIYEGISINTFEPGNIVPPFIYGGDAPNKTAGYNGSESRYCIPDSLNRTVVEGKVVLCDGISGGEEARASHAVGSIMNGDDNSDVAFNIFPLPVSYLSSSDGADLLKYLHSTSEPTATIMKSVGIKDESAPFVVSFSSRGPNPITSDLLKPDLTAPGVDILAAWSEATTVTGSPGDTRVVKYNIDDVQLTCPFDAFGKKNIVNEGAFLVYIVYLGDRPKVDFSAPALHTSMLEEVVVSASESILYSYQRSFNGFAAKLTNEEMLKISAMERVVSVFPNERKQSHTTSFSYEGFGPPPKKWKGSCQNFTCNNKIIGARYYRADGVFGKDDNIVSPRDTEGHGTHTASTAAGNLVTGANIVGLSSGTARGGAPSARIVVYKNCWFDGCYDADILAAFDDAIADGVDIISLSVGGFSPREYFNDSIAIGAFHAMKNGVLASISAGNSGPDPATITNVWPWFLSVAASTMDRKFVTKVMLGNGAFYEVSKMHETVPLKKAIS